MVGCTYRVLLVLCWALFMVTQARRLEDNRMAAASIDHTVIHDNIIREISEGLYEGDIVLTQEQKLFLQQRKATYPAKYWPQDSSGTVTVGYRFGDTIINQALVKVAITHWETNTCVRFQEVAPTVGDVHLNFIDAGYCASYVGRDPSMIAGQTIWLTRGCVTEVGPAVHEIGHALGFNHEQSRSDRDDHVQVMWNNIQAGMERNFDKRVTYNYGIPYDYWSVMHYGPNFFTSNGQRTLLAFNPIAQPLMGNRIGLSFTDKLMANTMYGCIERWLTECSLFTDPCKNMGYTGPACSCVCPEGTSGSLCEVLLDSYTDALIKLKTPYSGTITTPGIVSTPGYPTPIQTRTKFVKMLVAPNCYTVKLTVHDFEVYKRYTDGTCAIDGLIVRTQDDLGSGVPYCDKEIAPGTVFISGNNTIVLEYYNYNYAATSMVSPFRGFNATVEHILSDGCGNDDTPTDTTPATSTPTTTPNAETPTAETPTTEAPTIISSITETPTNTTPTTESLTSETPTTETPTTKPPTTEKTTNETPTTTTSITEASITETPTSEITTTETATTETPTTTISITETPTTTTPTTATPTTETITTETPTTETPTTTTSLTEIPFTIIPIIETQASEKTTTETPTTEIPNTAAQISTKLTTSKPTTKKTTTKKSTTTKKTTKNTTTKKTTTKKPTTTKTTTKKKKITKSITKKTTTKKTTTKKTTTKKTTTKKTTTKKKTSIKPTGTKPTSTKPTTKKTSTKKSTTTKPTTKKITTKKPTPTKPTTKKITTKKPTPTKPTTKKKITAKPTSTKRTAAKSTTKKTTTKKTTTKKPTTKKTIITKLTTKKRVTKKTIKTRKDPPAVSIINSGDIPLTVFTSSNGLCTLSNTSTSGSYKITGDSCSVNLRTSEPRYLKVTASSILSTAGEIIYLNSVFGLASSITSTGTGQSYVLPSSTTSLVFPSIAKTLGKSFELGLQVHNSDCHQIIKVDAGATGTLTKTNYAVNTMCEWWIQAPSGRKIQMTFSAFNVGTLDCAGDFLGIDTSGDPLYKSASKKYCATTSPMTVTSSGEKMNVLLKGIQGGYPGFTATYSVV